MNYNDNSIVERLKYNSAAMRDSCMVKEVEWIMPKTINIYNYIVVCINEKGS